MLMRAARDAPPRRAQLARPGGCPGPGGGGQEAREAREGEEPGYAGSAADVTAVTQRPARGRAPPLPRTAARFLSRVRRGLCPRRAGVCVLRVRGRRAECPQRGEGRPGLRRAGMRTGRAALSVKWERKANQIF